MTITSTYKTWQPETYYEKGDYVYPSNRTGIFHKCLRSGNSQSYNFGYSQLHEPTWKIFQNTEDGILFWKFVPYVSGTNAWEPKTIYNVGDNVVPTTGPVEVAGEDFMYQLLYIVAEPRWPGKPNQRIEDFETYWESHVSAQTFIPRRLQKKDFYVEVYENIDYIKETYTSDYDSAKYKHSDWTKVSLDALQAYVYENGYEYIIDILSLDKDQLEAIINYLQLIHFLKGTKQGLELVFNLLDMSYEIVEWWEKTPADEPMTWNLTVDLNLSNVKRDTIAKLVAFTRNYVYPKLKDFLIKYSAVLAEVDIAHAGFVDWFFETSWGPFAVTSIASAGWHDQFFESTWVGTVGDQQMITQSDDPMITQGGDNMVTNP